VEFEEEMEKEAWAASVDDLVPPQLKTHFSKHLEKKGDFSFFIILSLLGEFRGATKSLKLNQKKGG
jgi:hypothetical protein